MKNFNEYFDLKFILDIAMPLAVILAVAYLFIKENWPAVVELFTNLP